MNTNDDQAIVAIYQPHPPEPNPPIARAARRTTPRVGQANEHSRRAYVTAAGSPNDITGTFATSTVASVDGTGISYQSLGTGMGVIVVGGALRRGRDYRSFARVLSRSFAVHVIDRRGRGASGPQGVDYNIEKECEDLLAVQAATGATAVFGHSYGGLIALETARRTPVFSHLAVYEPGVSVNGSIPVGWMPQYREFLADGDTRSAFAALVRGSGFAPTPLAKMPLRYVRLILRLAISGDQWQQVEPLLEANLAENRELVRIDDGTLERYSAVTALVGLLGGRKSPTFMTTELFDGLRRAIPNSTAEIIDGLDHTAPDEKAPRVVAERVRAHICPPQTASSPQNPPTHQHITTFWHQQEASGGRPGHLLP